MNTITLSPALTLRNATAWLWAAAFVAGNLILPQLCHLFPLGGKMLLPIMLFTVVASVRFGLWCGLLTAVASPLAATLLFGAPSGDILTAVMLKSVVIALVFGLWRQKAGGFSLLSLVLLVIGCQLLCFTLEGAFLSGFAASWNDLLISWPGMLLQIAVAWLAVKYWK